MIFQECLENSLNKSWNGNFSIQRIHRNALYSARMGKEELFLFVSNEDTDQSVQTLWTYTYCKRQSSCILCCAVVEKRGSCVESWIFFILVECTSEYVLSKNLYSWLGEGHEDVDESITDQWQEKEEIHAETFEAPATDDMLRELENEVTEDYEIPDSFQKGIWMTKYI